MLVKGNLELLQQQFCLRQRVPLQPSLAPRGGRGVSRARSRVGSDALLPARPDITRAAIGMAASGRAFAPANECHSGVF